MANTLSNNAKENFLKGNIKGLTDTFKIILMNLSFVFDPDNHKTYADVSSYEVPNGFGYVTGGNILTGAITEIDVIENSAKLSWDNTSWTANGGEIETSGAIIYDSSASNIIISFIEINKTIGNGQILKAENNFVKFL